MHSRAVMVIFMLGMVVLSACGSADEPVAPTSSATPDPCAPEYVLEEVERVHALMRAFDDAANLASRTPYAQLAGVIPPLQDIRRQAEDQSVPACLFNLKGLQLAHMNVVIDTMLAFLGGANLEALNAGIAQARDLHDQYNRELAVLIGATYVPPATPLPDGIETPSQEASGDFEPPFVTNLGEMAVNLREAPDVNAASPGRLDVGASTPALGVSTDGLWIQVEIPGLPGQTAWLYASLVEVTGLELLEIVQP